MFLLREVLGFLLHYVPSYIFTLHFISFLTLFYSLLNGYRDRDDSCGSGKKNYENFTKIVVIYKGSK